MVSSEKNQLVKAIAPVLEMDGFKRKAVTWHRVGGVFIQTLNVQGVQWSKSFYLNLGVYIRALGGRLDPPIFECHVRNRVESLLEDASNYHRLLDFENDIPQDMRFREIVGVIGTHAIPWLEEYSDTGRIAAAIAVPTRQGLLVSPDVYDLLGVAMPQRGNRQ